LHRDHRIEQSANKIRMQSRSSTNCHGCEGEAAQAAARQQGRDQDPTEPAFTSRQKNRGQHQQGRSTMQQIGHPGEQSKSCIIT